MSGEGYHAGNVADVAAVTPGAFADGGSEGYTQQILIDHTHGSVHTHLSLHALEPGGRIDPHLHSNEEAIFILEGEVLAALDGVEHLLKPSDFAVALTARPHAYRNVSSSVVRWLEMRSPLPLRNDLDGDVYMQPGEAPRQGTPIAPGDPRWHFVGHFHKQQLSPLSGYGARAGDMVEPLEGPYHKWLVDRTVGSYHLNTFIIQFEPKGSAPLHDHPLEESYFILSGEVDVILGEETFHFKAGDFGWAGVNTPHSFVNRSDAPVRWLETQAPQLPTQGSRRSMAWWDKVRAELG